ncbi:MAG: hypothetical protein IH619_02750 [Ignavibacterium sp.]|nr:hypothetical protein [Ignavibacterium sp.]
MVHFSLRTIIILFMGLCIFLFLYCDESTGPTINSLKSAEKNVFVNLLNSNDSGKVVYELVYPLKAGTVIKATPPLDSTEYTAPAYSWFFFINDQPGLRWVHDCRYVFSDIYSGNLTVYDAQFYPECLDDMEIVNFQ